MFGLPIEIAEYLFLGLVAVLITIIALWIKNRIDARRERASELADELALYAPELAGIVRQYSLGDYSEAVELAIALAKKLKTSGPTAVFEDVAKRIMGDYAATNATKSQEFIDLLQNGAALKNATKPAV